MRYLMRQKPFAFTDKFVIKNDRDEEVGHIDGRVLSFGDQLSFRDATGTEVATIKQVVLAWGPTYELERNGVTTVVRENRFFFKQSTFTVDGPGPDDLWIEGDWTHHEYFFVRSGRTVATISKTWWSLADTYGVEIVDSEDPIVILACTVIIDLVLAAHERRS